MDGAPLNAVLRRDAVGSPQSELVGQEGNEKTGPPVRDVPLKEVLVPVAHLIARPLAVRFRRVPAVGVMAGPAVHMDAPQCSGLDPTRTTLLPDTLTPLAWKKEDRETLKLKSCAATMRFPIKNSSGSFTKPL